MPRTVVVVEFLLANELAWRDAPESMRGEALAMLTSVARDFAMLPDTDIRVPVSSDARPAVLRRGLPERSLQTIPAGQLPEWIVDNLAAPVCDESYAMLIAPETAGVLTSLLRMQESGSRGAGTMLNLPARLTDVFADKLATADWLKRHDLPTPDTHRLSSQQALELLQTAEHDSREPNAVLKPFDGCGSTLIRLLHITASSWPAAAGTDHNRDPLILQPLIPGEPWSIGIIGQAGAPPLLLPPAKQHMRRDGKRLSYAGGSIEPSSAATAVLEELAGRFAALLPPFLGYVGLDVVLHAMEDGAHQATIIEVNPRLCTSYIGYRAACRDNLAAALMGLPREEPLRWSAQSVHFHADGEVIPG
jgi:predicted ATP-grasp superfamily ATP-dependent carboligase